MHDNEIQIVVPAALRPQLEQWLRLRGMYLFLIPLPEDTDDLPTYGIGVSGILEMS